MFILYRFNYFKPMASHIYRSEIDGLRCFAVIPVVLYHILAALCPGGFAGVDVFFLISGYLITSGILRDLDRDKFTIRNFYYRRIRRIMPAYFALILGVFAVGCVLYYSTPLLYLSDTVISGSLFSSNFYFYLFSDNYFAPDVHNNALLHLWSLSVEEQFYLFIPLLCAFVWKRRRTWLRPLFLSLAITSFAGAIYAIHIGKASSAFYLIHFRAWELLAGSLLAMLPESTLSATHSHRAGALAWVGLILIVAPYFCLSSQSDFPGLAALPSVLGTALLVRYAMTGGVHRLLCLKPLVFIGKISYSLYLWHWPVIVFWKYAVYNQVYWFDYLGMGVLSFVLAYASWRWIESPVRNSATWTPRRCFKATAFGILALVAIGTICIVNNGFPNSLHVAANKMSSNDFPARLERIVIGAKTRVLNLLGAEVEDVFRLHFGQSGGFHLGIKEKSPQFILIGDSHAGHLQHGLDVLLREQNAAAYSFNCSNTPVFDLNRAESKSALACLAAHSSVKQVVLSQCWSGYYKREGDAMYPKLEAFVERMRSDGYQVFIATDIPSYGKAPNEIAARMQICTPRAGFSPEIYMGKSEVAYGEEQGCINKQLAAIANRQGAVLIPAHMALFDGHKFVTTLATPHMPVPSPMYRDENHLSYAGSEQVSRFILERMKVAPTSISK